MSYILQQDDNITILGDIYDYPTYTNEKENKEKRNAIQLQIIISVNGKQKISRFNFDFDRKTGDIIDRMEWDTLLTFITDIGYKIKFNLQHKVKEILEH